jgi:ankyrin repeat protein
MKKLTCMVLFLSLLHISIDGMQESYERLIDIIHQKDVDGKTVLFYAVARGHKHLVRGLLNLGANPNIQDFKYQQTPLHIAANLESGAFEGSIAQLLLEYGAHPNVFDKVVTSRKILSRTPAALAKSPDIKRGILEYRPQAYAMPLSHTTQVSVHLPVAYPVARDERS